MERHIKRLHKALDDIADILPWGPAEGEAMRRVAINALEWCPNNLIGRKDFLAIG